MFNRTFISSAIANLYRGVLAIDTDVLALHDLFRHVFPNFSLNHVLVYRSLWRIEPLSGERVIGHTGLSRATAYRILNELVAAGLVKKTAFKPIGYYAESPIKAYNNYLLKTVSKLRKGREKLKRIVGNSTSLSEEEYLVKIDGGQTKLINIQTREDVSDRQTLLEYQKGLSRKIDEIEKAKLKEWQMVGRN